MRIELHHCAAIGLGIDHVNGTHIHAVTTGATRNACAAIYIPAYARCATGGSCHQALDPGDTTLACRCDTGKGDVSAQLASGGASYGRGATAVRRKPGPVEISLRHATSCR